MVTIDLEKHDPKASELVALLGSSDEVLLTMGDVPWAIIRQAPSREEEMTPPIVSVLGMHPGNILYMSEDFNAPLPDSFWTGESPDDDPPESDSQPSL